ncbi:uncharacterized protein LOC141528275 isoform X1 [Cotesia typhae]|uniref:uncharacterized protein LOC141528275 isoform X1 n=1 Tax=Cotesia typhae TaxID=2053667 RepID=UPI003D694442
MARFKNDKICVEPSELSQKKVKRMKKKKDLERMRKNILAAKQQMKRSNRKQEKVAKSSFEKTLNSFAEIRQKNEDETLGHPDKKVKKKTICTRLLPEQSIGIFKNGAMGKEVRRPGKLLFSQQNEARLQGDIFKLLNGEEIPSPGKLVTENAEMQDDSSGPKSAFSAAKNDEKNTSNYGKTSNGRKDINAKKNSTEKKNVASKDLQSDKTKKLFEDDDDNTEDTNIESLPMDPLHFSPRASKDKYEDSQKGGGNDETDGGESEHCWDPRGVKLYQELHDKVEEYFDVDFSKLNMTDPMLEIKSRLANVYERTHGKRSASSNNNDTNPFPSTSQPHSEWSAEAQACTGTSDNNRFTPLNRLTKSKPTPHDYETVEARIINAMTSLPTGPQFPLGDPFFGATSPQYAASLSTVSSDALILSNLGNVDKTTTDQDINTSPASRRSVVDYLFGNTAQTNFMDSVTSVSSLPLGWDADAENQKNLIRRDLKHVPGIPRRTQPREILFDVENLTKVKAPPIQAHPKVTLLQEQAQAHPRVTQTQVHPLQTEACLKINIPNNHESFPREFFLPPLLDDKSLYSKPLNKESPYYPTPSLVMHRLNNEKIKNINVDSKSKDNFIFPKLNTKFVNRNPYCEIIKSKKDQWNINNQFLPPLPLPPPHLSTRTADAGTSSRYPFTFSANDFSKSRTGILKDDYAIFNGEKHQLNKPVIGIASTKPPGEQRNLNSHKQFIYSSWDLNTKSFKLFPEYSHQDGAHQIQSLNPQHIPKSMMYESIPIRKDFFEKNDDLSQKSKAPRKDYDLNRAKLSFLSANTDNYKLQDNGISDTVLENLKVLSFEEDQYPEKLFADHRHDYYDSHNHNYSLNRNNHYSNHHRRQDPHYYQQGYCQQEQLEKHFKNLSQPSKYFAVMNEHQSYPRVPQRVPIYFNEPGSINNQPTFTDTNARTNVGYHGPDNSEPYQPQDLQRKQIQSGVPIAVFTAKDRNLFLGSKVPDTRHLFDETKDPEKDKAKFVRFNEDVRTVRAGQMPGNQVREIILPNGQVGLFFPQTFVNSENSKDDGYLNQNHPNHR